MSDIEIVVEAGRVYLDIGTGVLSASRAVAAAAEAEQDREAAQAAAAAAAGSADTASAASGVATAASAAAQGSADDSEAFAVIAGDESAAAETARAAAEAAQLAAETAAGDGEAAAIDADISATDAAASAAAAAAALDELEPAVAYIGSPSPITGAALGNSTYVMDEVFDEDMLLVELISFGLGAGGNVKVKALDVVAGAWAGADLGTVAVGAGPVTTAISLLLPAGQRAAVFAQNVLGSVGNGAPLTAYWTIAGDVVAGAIGAQVTNTALQFGFKAVSFRDLADAKTDAIDERTTDERTKFLSLADSDLGASLSSTTVYYDPRQLPAGTPRALYLYGRVAGWATVQLAQATGETDHDVYRRFPVYLDVGKNTITPGSNVAGKGIPLDLVILPGTIAGALCPSGGGQVAYTNTDGPAAAGENVIGYLLPQGNFTGTAKTGVQTLTWSGTSNRQLAMEWVIEEQQSPRLLRPRRKTLLRETFVGTTLPTQLMVVGTAPTFTAGQAESTAVGFGNNLRARFGHSFRQQTREVDQRFGSSTSIIAAGTRPVAGGYGSAASADRAANTWTCYVGHNAVSSTPTIRTTRAWPGTFTDTSHLRWRFTVDGRVFRITLTDLAAQPVVSDYYEVDVTAADIPPAVTTPSESLNYIGQMSGALQSFALAGTVETIGVQEWIPQRAASGMIIGDSIVNAARCAYSDGWAQRLTAERAAIGLETVTLAMDGWDMPAGCIAGRQALNLLPDLEWCIVALGANRSSANEAREKAMFESSATALLNDLLGRGVEPYFLVNAPHTFSPGAATTADRIAFIEASAYTTIRGDKPLTQADGVTIDGSMFYANGVNDVHPITIGQTGLLERARYDAPEVFF